MTEDTTIFLYFYEDRVLEKYILGTDFNKRGLYVYLKSELRKFRNGPVMNIDVYNTRRVDSFVVSESNVTLTVVSVTWTTHQHTSTLSTKFIEWILTPEGTGRINFDFEERL